MKTIEELTTELNGVIAEIKQVSGGFTVANFMGNTDIQLDTLQQLDNIAGVVTIKELEYTSYPFRHSKVCNGVEFFVLIPAVEVTV